MAKVYPVDIQLTDQTIILPGAEGGSLKCYLSFSSDPTAGSVTIQYRPSGVRDWQPLAHVTDYEITEQVVSFRVDGPVAQIRILFDGLEGAGGARLVVDRSILPVDVFNGLAAMVTQPYTEANVKNGLEFYARAAWPLGDAIPTGQTRKIYFATGDKPVIIKLRGLSYVAEELILRLFESPTGVTGGSPLTVHNYNRISPVSSAVVDVRKNVATTSDGTEFNDSDPEYIFGASNQPIRAQGAIPEGRERILPANSEYLVTIENTGSGDARVAYFLDWYEGVPDLPL